MKVKIESEVTQLCLTLSDLMDCSLSCSSIHGIFQAGVLEWGAIAFSRPGADCGPYHQLLIGKFRLKLKKVGKTIREGNGTPLQYSCLENPMDGGAWWAAVHGVTELDTTE